MFCLDIFGPVRLKISLKNLSCPGHKTSVYSCSCLMKHLGYTSCNSPPRLSAADPISTAIIKSCGGADFLQSFSHSWIEKSVLFVLRLQEPSAAPRGDHTRLLPQGAVAPCARLPLPLYPKIKGSAPLPEPKPLPSTSLLLRLPPDKFPAVLLKERILAPRRPMIPQKLGSLRASKQARRLLCARRLWQCY